MKKKNHPTTKSVLFVLLALYVFLIGSILVLASVPPVSRDALIHHLAVPKLYLRHGIFTEFPDLIFSYYPMNLDLVYMAALKLGNDIVPKYIHFCFALLTSLLIYFYLTSRLTRLYGLLGSLFFLSIPIVVRLSVSVYVDLGLAFFTTAAMLLLFLWQDRGWEIRYLIVAGVCCGLAVGTKYNGLVCLGIFSAMVPLIYLRSGEDRQSRQAKGLWWGVVFVAAAICVSSPWYLRNGYWTGNPFHPLFDSLFNPTEVQSASTAMNQFVLRHRIYHESTLQILLLPFRIFFEGQDNSPQYFDGKLSPFLLVLPLFAFLSREQNKVIAKEQKAMMVFVVIYLVIAFFQTSVRIRYFIPAVPFMVIIGMFGLRNIFEYFQSYSVRHTLKVPLGSCIGLAIAVLMLSENVLYIRGLFNEIRPLSYISGKVSRDQYITQFRPEYPLIQYVNSLPEKNVKVLAVYLGDRNYYFDVPVKTDKQKDGTSYLLKVAQEVKTAGNIQQRLLENGITHLIIRRDLFQGMVHSELSPENLKVLDTFFQTGVTLVKQNTEYSLFSLHQI